VQRGLCPGGVDRGQDGGDGLTREVAHGAVVDPGQRRIDPDEPQVGVEDRHPGGRVAQHGIREPGFKLTQSGLPLLWHGGVGAQPSTSPAVQAPATGGSFLLPRCQSRHPPGAWRHSADGAVCLPHRSGPSEYKRATNRVPMLPASVMRAKSESPPPPVPPAVGSLRRPQKARNTTRTGSMPSERTMMAAWVNSPTADDVLSPDYRQPYAGTGMKRRFHMCRSERLSG
jgi:hypothetical protein